ncbi:MAG: hypothetical protein M1133_15390 [Armatimonadetes bacterium]|nr:hypothetical protein [Armatimonadota bacterium]
MKKLLCAAMALLVFATGPVLANYILLAPSGTTLSTGQVRAEAAFSPNNDDGKFFWLGTGLMQLELNVIAVGNPGSEKTENRVGAQWSFLPETSITPAVGFGVTDVASESHEGIGGYAVVTKHLRTGAVNPFVKELSLTGGIGAGGIKGPFAGVEARLPMGIFLQAEYDSHDFNGAVGWQPISLLRFKAYTLRDNFYFGAELRTIRF